MTSTTLSPHHDDLDTKRATPFSPSNHSATYFILTNGIDVNNERLQSCADLFSKNYGVWSFPPHKSVHLSAQRLRTQCLSDPEHTVLVTCIHDGLLVGHAFATTWNRGGDTVGWITQLVVDKKQRKRYIATTLLQQLKHHPLFENVNIIGLASSHPAACNALAKFARVSMRHINLAFIAENAASIIASTPITYLQSAQLRGTLFNKDDSLGAISSVFTNFPIDHQEPLQVLSEYVLEGKWPLGALLESHEILIILPVPLGASC